MPTPLAADHLVPGPLFVLALLVALAVVVAVVVLVVVLVLRSTGRRQS